MGEGNGNITSLKDLYTAVGNITTRLEVLLSRFENHTHDVERRFQETASDILDMRREVADLKKSMIPIQYQQEVRKTGLQFWAAIIVAGVSAAATIAVAVLR